MKRASKILSASLALALGVSAVSYGATASKREVIAEPAAAQAEAALDENAMGGYLFVTFVGNDTAKNKDDEQIYFGISRDAKVWTKVNGAQPVLKSTVGEEGVRDPSIIRKPDGSGFYIVATDLSIARRQLNEIGEGNAWGDCQQRGSHKLVVWESADLTNWSGPWLTPEIAVSEAGCAWAPEAFWDATREKYMVFWASPVAGRHRIYRSFTEDFKTFTPAEIYMDEGGRPWIDATIIEDNGTFYRFTKHEGAWKIYMEKSKSLDGPFEFVDTYTLDGKACYDYNLGFEGPTCFKVNNEEKWCLFNDNAGGGVGYIPYFTDNLSEGKFTRSYEVILDGDFRHGSVLPITVKEYNAICEKWAPGEEIETGKCIYTLDFTQNSFTDKGNLATPVGLSDYIEERAPGKYAANISGDGNYIRINGSSLISGLDSMTFSFMANVSGKSWMLFAAANEDAIYYNTTDSNYIGCGYLLDKYTGIKAQRFMQRANAGRPAEAKMLWVDGNNDLGYLNTWVHIAVVQRAGSMELYINGKLVSKVSSTVNLKNLLGETPVICLGKATWEGGEYSNFKLDAFRIYNYARSAEEILAEYNELK